MDFLSTNSAKKMASSVMKKKDAINDEDDSSKDNFMAFIG
jgi:hypothetical protein